MADGLLQPQHGKLLVNPCVGDPPDRLVEIAYLAPCEGVDALLAWGVRYVIVDRARPDIADCLRHVDGATAVSADRTLTVFEAGARRR